MSGYGLSREPGFHGGFSPKPASRKRLRRSLPRGRKAVRRITAFMEGVTRLICRRCGARTKLARQLPWIDHRLPAVPLFQCIDWGHVDLFEWPEPEGLSPRQTPPSSREAARGGVRELVEKHGSGRRTHHRHQKFPLAMALPSILRGVVLLFGAASSSFLEPLSLGFHGGQSSIECSHPCGDGRILSYSL